MKPLQNNLVSEILSTVKESYKRDHVAMLQDWSRREDKILEAQRLLQERRDLMRKARSLAGCNNHDSVPVRVAGINEKSPRKPVMRGKYYHKYSWKHPAGFRCTEYEPSTRYVCVSVSWVMRYVRRVNKN
jgi:hypothetical protein